MFFPVFIAFSVLFSSCTSSFLLTLIFNLFIAFFSFSHFLLRDKAPGQRECDSSIDNINKCIRDIEQASLAAVSQNLPSRDDISLEVSNLQKMTRHFPQTSTGNFLCLHCLSLSVCLSQSLTFFCLFIRQFNSQTVCFSCPCVAFCVSNKLWICYWYF